VAGSLTVPIFFPSMSARLRSDEFESVQTKPELIVVVPVGGITLFDRLPESNCIRCSFQRPSERSNATPPRLEISVLSLRRFVVGLSPLDQFSTMEPH
jgi:hypothetical protein